MVFRTVFNFVKWYLSDGMRKIEEAQKETSSATR